LGRAASPSLMAENNYAMIVETLVKWDVQDLPPKLPLPFDDLYPI